MRYACHEQFDISNERGRETGPFVIYAALLGKRLDEEYGRLIGEVSPLESARELIAGLKERGLTVVLASSAPQDEIDHYLELLDARELADAWTTDDDVKATKPEPDLRRRLDETPLGSRASAATP